MKVLSILLALVNSLVAGLVLLSCVSVSNLSWDGLGWLGVRVATGALVILAGILTFRDGTQGIAPGKMLVAGLLLVLLGTGSAMWGVHLTIVDGDIKNVMILFGGSLVLQGIASIVGLRESGGMAV
ncbi:MAG: hypothetical protein JXB38_10540 [Anaerolineales bacterium]|nr:hypothetical protein [Anaerolineales bacterium]